jgi:hypothetical protein
MRSDTNLSMIEVKSDTAPASVNTRMLLAIAAVLIVNSHLEAYYPVSFLAGDGLFGYGLFFFIAGIGLALSAKREMRSFGDYCWRRFARIYPTFWLMRISFGVVHNDFADMDLFDVMKVLIWPTDNTFIGPLMLDYVLLYFVLRPKSVDVIRKTMIALMVPIVGLWISLLSEMHRMQQMSLNWLFAGLIYFQMMLFGSYLAADVGPERKYRFGWDTVAVGGLFGVYVTARFYIQRSTLPAAMYPLLFVLLAALFYFLFQIACSYELAAILKHVPKLAQLVSLVGASTLELYFVHERLAPISFLQQIMFPMNIVALWVLLLPLAVLLEKGVTAMRKKYLKVS